MANTIRMHTRAWITDIRFTEGVGFQGNDELVVKHLNNRATEEGITTCEGALNLARTEFLGVEQTPEDAVAAVDGPTITEAEAVSGVAPVVEREPDFS